MIISLMMRAIFDPLMGMVRKDWQTHPASGESQGQRGSRTCVKMSDTHYLV